jgi:hypothetical protein
MAAVLPINAATMAEADALYSEGKFAEAATQYQSILETGKVSADLYYNLGNTYYRMIFEKTATSPEGFEKMVFRASIEINPYLPFIKPGEKVIIRYQENGNIYEISSLEVV